MSLDQAFSEYLNITENKSLAYPLAGYEKLAEADKKTIEHLIMYFNKK